LGKISVLHHSFAVGVQDKKHLARVDLERMRLAAEEQTNLLAMTTGPGFMRPGLGYIGTTGANEPVLRKFEFSATDAALLVFTNQLLTPYVNDIPVARNAVSATVADGTFTTGAGWTLAPTAGATALITGGNLVLAASARGSKAIARQTVAVSQVGIEHALRIVVERGPVTLRVGSASTGDDLVEETELRTGTHSIAFTPSGANFYIELNSSQRVARYVNSCVVEGAGVVTLPTPWPLARLSRLRLAQSADVIFAACVGYQQRRIERRSARSWSIVLYTADDGPFTVGRTRNVKLKSSVYEGNGTLTSDTPFFSPGHVGVLFKLTHSGQSSIVQLAADNAFTEPFKVTGVSAASFTYTNDRDWNWQVSGTWAGTLKVLRSYDDAQFGYKPFRRNTSSTTIDITANAGPETNGDEEDNAEIWYKIGFEPGTYTSGSAVVATSYDGGGGYGICRVIAYNSPTEVAIDVLRPFTSVEYSEDWQEGEWSALRGWPSAVAFADGRLFWSGMDRLWGSVSDGYESFDETVEGDSGPIARSIATGGVNDTHWLLGLHRLNIGTSGSVSVAKSSSLDEPLTPTSLSIRDSSTTGVAPIDPVKMDSYGLFVERSGKAIMESVFDAGGGDYVTTELSKLTTDIFREGVKELAIQRRPDTRIWAVLNDGSAVCIVYDPSDKAGVVAFIPVATDSSGLFRSVTVLPGIDQDRVYFGIRRTLPGGVSHFIEKMALDSEARPATLCKVMDSFLAGTIIPGSPTVSVPHLAGMQVVMWINGAPVETSPGEPTLFTVSGGGLVTLPQTYATPQPFVCGLAYRMRYKSARLAYGATGGTAMLKKKKVNELGLIMTDFTRHGIRYGGEFDNPNRPLNRLPSINARGTAPAIVLGGVQDEDPFIFDGPWDTDSRICLEWSSPYTCTLMALTGSIDTSG